MISTDRFIRAARVPPTLRPQQFGLWQITRPPTHPDDMLRPTAILSHTTLATMHQSPGFTVMEDSARELRRHVPAWRHGRGRVLVSGLGLGCVVRGLLLKPEIERVDVVEIDADIIRVVGPEFADDTRVAIHHGDALTFDWPPGARWDLAWHDLTTPADHDDSLPALHTKLIFRFLDRCQVQGCWGAGARVIRRIMPKGRIIAA